MSLPSPQAQACDHAKGSDETRPAHGSGRSPRQHHSCMSGHGISATAPITDVEIYYGTMFGIAERFARALAHDILIHRHARVHVQDLDAFDEVTFARSDRLVPSRLFVIVVGTHFAGAPPPSAERFRDWIQALAAPSGHLARMASRISPKAHAASSGTVSLWPFPKHHYEPLRSMQYAVFAVGDSVYLTYNAMGKLVDLKFKQLGALRFHPLGLGDMSNNIDGAFHAWQSALLAKLPHSMSPSLVPTETPVAKLPANAIVPWREAPKALAELRVVDKFGRAVALDFSCRILGQDEVDSVHLYTLYPTSSRTRTLGTEIISSFGLRTPRIALFDRRPFAEIETAEVRPGIGSGPPSRRSATFRVHFRHPSTTYTSVSTLAVFPENSHDYVARVAHAFGYDLDAVIELTPPRLDESDVHSQQTQLPFPTPCTVRTALTEFLDVRTLTREFIRTAAGFVATADEHAMLEHLGSIEDATAFRTQIAEQYRGVLELVELAPTLRLPLEVFVNITPPIKPRFYTIASSPRVSPHEFDVAVSLGVAGEPHGLGVSYLERIAALPHGTRVPFRGFISWTRFQFPDDDVSPMVLIAIGVGLSAMRAIVQERLARWCQAQKTTMIPPMLLFLGASSKEHVVFRNDLNRWEQQMMVKVHYAFSNDPHHPKRHVQDVVASRMEEIVDVLKSSNGSRIFVCGRVNLVRRIRDLFEVDQLRRGSRWFDAINASGRFIEQGSN